MYLGSPSSGDFGARVVVVVGHRPMDRNTGEILGLVGLGSLLCSPLQHSHVSHCIPVYSAAASAELQWCAGSAAGYAGVVVGSRGRGRRSRRRGCPAHCGFAHHCLLHLFPADAGVPPAHHRCPPFPSWLFKTHLIPTVCLLLETSLEWMLRSGL